MLFTITPYFLATLLIINPAPLVLSLPFAFYIPLLKCHLYPFRTSSTLSLQLEKLKAHPFLFISVFPNTSPSSANATQTFKVDKSNYPKSSRITPSPHNQHKFSSLAQRIQPPPFNPSQKSSLLKSCGGDERLIEEDYVRPITLHSHPNHVRNQPELEIPFLHYPFFHHDHPLSSIPTPKSPSRF